jgi:hypothetical protein
MRGEMGGIFYLHKYGYKRIIITVRNKTHTRKGQKMKQLEVQAMTKTGIVAYTVIKVSDDYTMNEVVRKIKEQRYDYFRLVDTMKRFVEI